MIEQTIWQHLCGIARDRCRGQGPAHDFTHVERVVASAAQIARAEGAKGDVVLPAALLHELFNYPKDHPDSARSGEVCADEAEKVLGGLGVSVDLTAAVAEAIRDHPYSLGRVPPSLEGKVLQDADRLDAIGAIGVARCFAACGEMGRPLYNPEDPFCRVRQPEDKSFGLDHFYKKLLRIPDGLHTATAREMAAERVRFLREFLDRLAREIPPTPERAQPPGESWSSAPRRGPDPPTPAPWG
jgi:uncharacterized protein